MPDLATLVGYVVVRQSEPGTFPYPEYSLVDGSLWDDRNLAEDTANDHRTEADAVGEDRRYFVAEVHEAEETS